MMKFENKRLIYRKPFVLRIKGVRSKGEVSDVGIVAIQWNSNRIWLHIWYFCSFPSFFALPTNFVTTPPKTLERSERT